MKTARWVESAWAFGVLLLLGLGIVLFPSARSGRLMSPGDLGDARFNHYLLEHHYLWFIGRADHAEYWSPPYFHPVKNTLAYSDVMAPAALVYVPLRLAGADPATAYWLWWPLVCVGTYALAFAIAKRADAGSIGSALAAFVTVFGAPRLVRPEHSQLLTVACTLFGLLAVLVWVRAPH